MPTIAHISDLHLHSGKPERQAQVEPILQKINEMKPDLVVISGDVTDDGWDSIEELKWAKDWLEKRIEGDWFAVPGNHDVGNFVTMPKGVVAAERVQMWERVFGELWTRAVDDWVLIGLNSMLFGSGLVAEAEQAGWLDDAVAGIRDRGQHLAVLLHSPLFVQSIDEAADAEAAYWLGPSAARHAAWNTLKQANPRLLCSGHVHQKRLASHQGVTIAWAPPMTGTWVHAPGLPNPPMPENTGFFLHTLHEDGRVESELIECAPMLKLYKLNPSDE